MLCIRPIHEKKWEYNNAVQQLVVDFKKVYVSIRNEFLYNIPTEFCITMKLVRLIKMCLKETYSTVQVGKNFSDMFHIRNGMKQGDALSIFLFNLALDYTTRRVQINEDGLKLKGMHLLLVYADDVNILEGSVHTVQEMQKF